MDFYEKLIEYFKNTPREQVLASWEKSKKWDNVGPTINDYLYNFNQLLPNLKIKRWKYRKMNKKKSLRQKD